MSAELEEMNAKVERGFESLKTGMTRMVDVIDGIKVKLDLVPPNTKLAEDSADRISRLMFTFNNQLAQCRAQVRSVSVMGPAYSERCNELFSTIDTVTLKSAAVMARIKELRG